MYGQTTPPSHNFNQSSFQSTSIPYQQLLANQQQLQFQFLNMQQQDNPQTNFNQLQMQQLQQQRLLHLQQQQQISAQQLNSTSQAQLQSGLANQNQTLLFNNNQIRPQQSQLNSQRHVPQSLQQLTSGVNEQERINIIYNFIKLLRTVIPPQAEERIQFLAQNLELKAFRTATSREMYITTIHQQMASISQKRTADLIGNNGMPSSTLVIDNPVSPHLLAGQSSVHVGAQQSPQMLPSELQRLQNQQQQAYDQQQKILQQSNHLQMLQEQKNLQPQSLLQQQGILPASGANILNNGVNNSTVSQQHEKEQFYQKNDANEKSDVSQKDTAKYSDKQNPEPSSTAINSPKTGKKSPSPKVDKRDKNTLPSNKNAHSNSTSVTSVAAAVTGVKNHNANNISHNSGSVTATTISSVTPVTTQSNKTNVSGANLSSSAQSNLCEIGLPNSVGQAHASDSSIIASAAAGAPVAIRMTPANLTEEQKVTVVEKIKDMAPLYRNIHYWIEVLITYGSEKELDMVKKLQGMKRMLEAQLEGFQLNQGVYYLTPETVTQLQQNLYRFYQYTENLKIQHSRIASMQQGMGGGTANSKENATVNGLHDNASSHTHSQDLSLGTSQPHIGTTQQQSNMPFPTGMLKEPELLQNFNRINQHGKVIENLPQQNIHMGVNVNNAGMGMVGQSPNLFLNQMNGAQLPNSGHMMFSPQVQANQSQLTQQLQQILQTQFLNQSFQNIHTTSSEQLLNTSNPVRQHLVISPQLSTGHLSGKSTNSTGVNPVATANITSSPQFSQQGQNIQHQQTEINLSPKTNTVVPIPKTNTETQSLNSVVQPLAESRDQVINSNYQLKGDAPIPSLGPQQQNIFLNNNITGGVTIQPATQGMGSQYVNLNAEQQNALKKQMEQQIQQNMNNRLNQQEIGKQILLHLEPNRQLSETLSNSQQLQGKALLQQPQPQTVQNIQQNEIISENDKSEVTSQLRPHIAISPLNIATTLSPNPISNLNGPQDNNEENIDSLFDFNYESPPPTKLDESVELVFSGGECGTKRPKPETFEDEIQLEKKRKNTFEEESNSVSHSLDEFQSFLTPPVSDTLGKESKKHFLEEELKALEKKYPIFKSVIMKEEPPATGDFFSSDGGITVVSSTCKNFKLIFKINSRSDYENDNADCDSFLRFSERVGLISVDCQELDSSATGKVLKIKNEIKKLGINDSCNENLKISDVFVRLGPLLE
ncbi:hypothetical protein HDU92_004752 [Lobulomyces angularis]|nr:hypothetical protein HDU92_004752 [Lobulomyces angularis]